MNIIFKRDTWQEIYYALRNNKLRTFLTMIGVGWGMFLYVSLLGSAKGVENGFNKIFKGFATNSIFLWAEQTSIPFNGLPKGRRLKIHLEDMKTLKQKIPQIKYISPRTSRGSFGSSGQVISRNGQKGEYTVTGDFPIGNKISKKNLVYGRYINNADINANKDVIVIGNDIYKKLFDAKRKENPLGKKVKYNGRLFSVIGVFKMKKVGNSADEQTAYIPFTTFGKMYHTGNEVGVFAIVCQPNANLKYVENKAKSVLKKEYNVSPQDNTAFSSFNLGEQFNKATSFLSGMKFLTIAVGVLTILAGVIAIASILLITVKERTKEIGIRRALGAKPKDVRNQILLESVVITLFAGLMGFLLGVLLLMALDAGSKTSDDAPFSNPTVAYTNVFVALAVMVLLGLIIGLIPAEKAVKIKPIDALRSE